MKEKELIENGEIDLVEAFKTISKQRLLLIKMTVICLVLGLVIAFTSKVEYEASCTLLPESQEGGISNLGGLGGLAGLAGFDVSGIDGSSSLSPELYPTLINSSQFLERLIKHPIYFEAMDTTVSSFVYLKEIDRPSLLDIVAEYTIGLPGKIKSSFSSSQVELKNYDFVRYSKEDWELIKDYRDRLYLSVDPDLGTIEVSVQMPDAVASAMITDHLVKELMTAVTNYKIERSQQELDFIQERYDEAKEEYEMKQNQLASFTDRNRNLANAIIQNEYERLQNELDISFEVYKGLATQLEQAKIKVKEDTPIFTVLEPIRIPEKKSKPRRLLILISFSLFGLFSSIAFVLTKNYLQSED